MIKTHNVTGMKYLCVTTRKNYEAYLGSGKYWKQHLKKHGRDFKTELLIELPADRVEEFNFKCKWISEWYDVANSKEWANLCHEAGYEGGTPNLSEESRKKRSEARKGRTHSEETKKKISEGNKGMKRNPFSDETRKKMTEARKGKKRKPFSEEHRKNMSEARKGQALTDETRQKLSETQKGRTHSAETRKKISEANKGRTMSEESRKKLSASLKGRTRSDETRKKMSESRKAYYTKRKNLLSE